MLRAMAVIFKTADGKEVHGAAVQEERPLFLAHRLFLPHHHGAVDRGQGRLVGESGAQDAFKLLCRQMTENAGNGTAEPPRRACVPG